MSDIQRICPNCNRSAPIASHFCPACGFDAQAGLPTVTRSSLPATIGKAALPVLVGAATIALRAGWRLLHSRLAEPTMTPTNPPPTHVQSDVVKAHRPQRRIRIRSTWAVGDGTGVWRQGASEHIIDFDE